MIALDETGLLKPLADFSGYTRRQDAPAVFDIATVAYCARGEYIKTSPSLYASERVAVHLVPPERCIDIDEELDLKMAEFLWNKV